MSANSLFRDLTGERDAIVTESRTTVVVGAAGASATRFREWRVFSPDKCSITRIDVMWSTAGSAPSGIRNVKIKMWSMVPTGTAHVAKGLCSGSMATTTDRNVLTLLPTSASTFPAGHIGFANAGGFPTGGVGVKLGVYITKGHVQA